MATKSFLKENIIETEEEAIKFINALEQAEKAAKKRKKLRYHLKLLMIKKE